MKQLVFGVLLTAFSVVIPISTIEIYSRLSAYWQLFGSAFFVITSCLLIGVPLMFGFMGNSSKNVEQ